MGKSKTRKECAKEMEQKTSTGIREEKRSRLEGGIIAKG